MAKVKMGVIGCGSIAALGFVAVVWMLITLAAIGRAGTVGWPRMVRDEGALTLFIISWAMLGIVVVYRNEILKPNRTKCPQCGGKATRGQFSAWQFILAVCFFPIGLLALLAGREPTTCPNCGHAW